MKIQDAYSIKPDSDGWRTLSDGRKWKIGRNCSSGNNFTAGDDFTVGNGFMVGNRFMVGNGFMVGDRFTAGDDFTVGNGFTAGDDFTVGNGFMVGDRFNFAKNIDAICDSFPAEFIMVKWVTQDRKSPNFDGGTILSYKKGEIVKAKNAKRSDKQCDKGIHVFLPGVRPEWYGYCRPDHNYQPIFVKCKKENLLFPGYPGDLSKLRLSEVKVIS